MAFKKSNRPDNAISALFYRLFPFYVVPQQHIGLTAGLGGTFDGQSKENAGIQFKIPILQAGWSVPTGSQLLESSQGGSIIKVSSQTTDKLDVTISATAQIKIVNPMIAEAVTGGDYSELQHQIEQAVRAKISATASRLPADALRESAELVASQMRDNLNSGIAGSFVVDTEKPGDATPEKVTVVLGSGKGVIEHYGIEIERINISEVGLSAEATQKLEQVRASEADIRIKSNEAIQHVIEAEGRANALNNARAILVKGWGEQIAAAKEFTGLPIAQVMGQVMELLRWDAGKNLVDNAGKGTVILTDAGSSMLGGNNANEGKLIAVVNAAVDQALEKQR